MKIAVSGKGGVGKTTIAAALTKLLARTYECVYAIDADPDACLAAAVGLPEEVIANLTPIIEMKDLISEKSGGDGAYFTLNPDMDDVLENYSIKMGNIRFMRMGGIKQGGSACYCRENSFLSALVSSLLFEKKSAVVMDMGAGIEHLTRGTARGVDYMLIVVEPGKNSVNTAKLVQKLAGDLGIKKMGIVANKIRSEKEKEFIRQHFREEEILGFIPFDEEIWDNAMGQGTAAELKGEFLASMQEIHDKILREVGEMKA